MDGERSASENLAKRAFFRSSQNLAISKPRLRKYGVCCHVTSRSKDQLELDAGLASGIATR